MMSVKFLPWIGDLYAPEGNFDDSMLRIFVLGNSHFLGDPVYPSTYTREVVECAAITRSKPHKFFTIIPRVLFGDHLSIDETIYVWKRISFANYIQEPIPGPRVKIKDKEWNHYKKEAFPAFSTYLEELRPHALVVCGEETYNHLPDQFSESTRLSDEVSGKKFFYGQNHDVALSVSIMHPSSSKFSYQNERPKVSALFNALKNTIPNAKFPNPVRQ